MTKREHWEELELQFLSPFAVPAKNSRGREKEEEPCPYRTVFQRDRDRILHSKAFRRLKHKTQVFLSPEGDHYRTRLTHTLEVSQIARTMARALRMNEDLTEAIALGHDLGHTPFGHAGERTLQTLMNGGFQHYEQSVRVVTKLEPLNLTYEVLDGIDRHTAGDWAATNEGKLVRLADRIAYINHDMDDAIRAGVLTERDVPETLRARLGETRGERIDTLVAAVVEQGEENVHMEPAVQQAFEELHRFMFDALYLNPIAKSEEDKVDGILTRLFRYFENHSSEMPEEYVATCATEGAARAACDYIAGMTDIYALETYDRLFIPHSWKI